MLILSDCSNLKKQSLQTEKLNIDDSKIVILDFKQDYYWLFKNVINDKLNNEEIFEIEEILQNVVKSYNIEQKKKFGQYQTKNPNGSLKLEQMTIDLSNYKRQYIAIKNEIGQKEVWVNMFCYDILEKWRTEIVDVSDGGNCYFNFKINLTKNKYYELMFNGEA